MAETFVFGLICEEDLSRGVGTLSVTLPDGSVTTLNSLNLHSFIHKPVAPTYGTTVSINASLGDLFVITVTDGTAFAIAAPTNVTTNQEITIRVKNSSGGTMGNITWNAAYHMATLTKPASAMSKSITFYYDGSVWIEVNRTPSDVSN